MAQNVDPLEADRCHKSWQSVAVRIDLDGGPE